VVSFGESWLNPPCSSWRQNTHTTNSTLNGTGAYTGDHKEVIFSIITLTERAKMKEMVFDIDSNAFMVVNDTLEVFGRRHGTWKVY